jgi:hypothetical protein
MDQEVYTPGMKIMEMYNVSHAMVGSRPHTSVSGHPLPLYFSAVRTVMDHLTLPSAAAWTKSDLDEARHAVDRLPLPQVHKDRCEGELAPFFRTLNHPGNPLAVREAALLVRVQHGELHSLLEEEGVGRLTRAGFYRLILAPMIDPARAGQRVLTSSWRRASLLPTIHYSDGSFRFASLTKSSTVCCRARSGRASKRASTWKQSRRSLALPMTPTSACLHSTLAGSRRQMHETVKSINGSELRMSHTGRTRRTPRSAVKDAAWARGYESPKASYDNASGLP